MTDDTGKKSGGNLAKAKDALAAKMRSEGMDPAASIMPREMLEGMYTMAHAAYSVENYVQAESLFMGMILFSPGDLRGWLGYGGACEAQKKWPQAIEGFAGALNLAPDDPVAPYRAGICMMALELRDEARGAFRLAAGARDKVADDPARLPYVQRAESMLRLLDAGQAA